MYGPLIGMSAAFAVTAAAVSIANVARPALINLNPIKPSPLRG
jgi:hypothetical protein